MLDFLFTKTPLSFFTQNLWRDEAFSYIMAGKPILQIFGLTAGDFSPPFYYLVLHFWIKIFGTSEVGLRSLSFLCYMLTVFFVYEILVEVFKIHKVRAAIYLVLLAVNPFLTYYAFEARMYMMVTLLVTISYFALWKNYRKMYVISITLAMYTHYFAAFILAAQLLSDVIHNYDFYKEHSGKIVRSLSKPVTILWKNIWNVLYPKQIFFLPLASFLPWVIFTVTHNTYRDGSFWIIKPALSEIFYIPFLLYSGYERIFGEYYHGKAGYHDVHTDMLYLLYIVLLTPVVIKAIFSFSSNRKELVNSYGNLTKSRLSDVLLWSFFPPVIIFLLSQVIQPTFHPRYYIFSSIGFLLLLISVFECFFSHIKIKFPALIGVFLFVFLIIKTNDYTALNIKYHYKRNVAKMAHEIDVLLKPKDYAYVTSELDYHLYQYYMRPDKVKIYGKTYEEIPAYVGKVLIPKSALALSLPTWPSRAFMILWDTYSVRSN
jgi:uncharacterized membrane protein